MDTAVIFDGHGTSRSFRARRSTPIAAIRPASVNTLGFCDSLLSAYTGQCAAQACGDETGRCNPNNPNTIIDCSRLWLVRLVEVDEPELFTQLANPPLPTKQSLLLQEVGELRQHRFRHEVDRQLRRPLAGFP